MDHPMTQEEWAMGLAFLEALKTNNSMRYMLANLNERLCDLEAKTTAVPEWASEIIRRPVRPRKDAA